VTGGRFTEQGVKKHHEIVQVSLPVVDEIPVEAGESKRTEGQRRERVPMVTIKRVYDPVADGVMEGWRCP